MAGRGTASCLGQGARAYSQAMEEGRELPGDAWRMNRKVGDHSLGTSPTEGVGWLRKPQSRGHVCVCGGGGAERERETSSSLGRGAAEQGQSTAGGFSAKRVTRCGGGRGCIGVNGR